MRKVSKQEKVLAKMYNMSCLYVVLCNFCWEESYKSSFFISLLNVQVTMGCAFTGKSSTTGWFDVERSVAEHQLFLLYYSSCKWLNIFLY